MNPKKRPTFEEFTAANETRLALQQLDGKTKPMTPIEKFNAQLALAQLGYFVPPTTSITTADRQQAYDQQLHVRLAKLRGPANPRHEEYINLYINTCQNQPQYSKIKDLKERESTMRTDAYAIIRDTEAAQAKAKTKTSPQQQFQYPQLSIYPQNQQPFQYNNNNQQRQTNQQQFQQQPTHSSNSNNSSNNSNTHNYQHTHKTSNHSNTTTNTFQQQATTHPHHSNTTTNTFQQQATTHPHQSKTTTNTQQQQKQNQQTFQQQPTHSSNSNHFKTPEENNPTNTHIQNAIKLLTHLLQKNEIFAQLSSEEILKFYIKAKTQGGYKIKMAKNNHDKSLSRFSNAIQKESLDLGITWSNSGERHNSRGMRTKSMIDYVGGEDKLRRIVNYVKNQTGRGK